MSVFGVFLVRIQSGCGKIRTRKTRNTDTFHAVQWMRVNQSRWKGSTFKVIKWLFFLPKSNLCQLYLTKNFSEMTFQSAITCSKLTIETLEQRCEIWPKLTIKTPKYHWHRFGVFIVNFEHISHLYSSVSILNFEHVNTGWVRAFSRNRTNILKTPNHIPTITNFLSRKSVIVDFVQNFQFKELLLFLPTLSRSSII